MKYKNIEEMIMLKNAYQERINSYQTEILKAKTYKKSCDKKGDKKYWNEVIDNYKNVVNDIKLRYNDLNNQFDKYCFFPEELLIPFLLECINLNEEKSYVYHKIMVNESINKTDFYVQNYTFYNMIFSKELENEIDKIEKSFFISRIPSIYNNFLNDKQEKNIMCVSTYEKGIIPHGTFNPIFKDFPYLENIGYNLANRRINEPDKSLVDILDDELEYQKEEVKVKKLN